MSSNDVVQETKETFDTLYNLSTDLIPTGKQVMTFSGRHVEYDSKKLWFDWDGFESAVRRYKGSDFLVVDIQNSAHKKLVPVEGTAQKGSIVKQGNVVRISSVAPDIDVDGRDDVLVAEVIDWITKTLRDDLGVTINQTELRKDIETTLTDLKWAHEKGFADFSSSSDGKNSSWEYRVVYANPGSSDTDSKFYSLVTTIKLEADIKEESSWWGLVKTTSKRFCVTINAEKFLVTKGFTDPGF